MSRAYAGAMSELADGAALIADRTRARILEQLLGGTPLLAGALAVAGRRRALERLGTPGQARGRGIDRRPDARAPARGVARAPRGHRGARGAGSARARGRPAGRPARRQRPRGAARGAVVLRPSRGPRGS